MYAGQSHGAPPKMPANDPRVVARIVSTATGIAERHANAFGRTQSRPRTAIRFAKAP
jgi:hypothetical protein